MSVVSAELGVRITVYLFCQKQSSGKPYLFSHGRIRGNLQGGNKYAFTGTCVLYDGLLIKLIYLFSKFAC